MHFKVRQHNTKSNANCRRKKRKLLPETHLSPTTLTTTSTILRKEKKLFNFSLPMLTLTDHFALNSVITGN